MYQNIYHLVSMYKTHLGSDEQFVTKQWYIKGHMT